MLKDSETTNRIAGRLQAKDEQLAGFDSAKLVLATGLPEVHFVDARLPRHTDGDQRHNQRKRLEERRKPRLGEVFNIENDWGLGDLLREKSSLRDSPVEALVRPTYIPNLSILTSGRNSAGATNLLYSSRMVELLQRLRCDFDHILIDSPPMLLIADARILGRLVDGVILVCRAGKTHRDSAFTAKQRLTRDGIPVLGTILNGWDVKGSSRYSYDYEYYQSEK